MNINVTINTKWAHHITFDNLGFQKPKITQGEIIHNNNNLKVEQPKITKNNLE